MIFLEKSKNIQKILRLRRQNLGFFQFFRLIGRPRVSLDAPSRDAHRIFEAPPGEANFFDFSKKLDSFLKMLALKGPKNRKLAAL